MSGIFKSVKKVLKKVGKLVKKVAPYLILAAGVYFGGSYLMSVAGGASAGAAGSAAQSFTKSAGVWKSFLGGLANGNAAGSAAAYAESSYKVMQAGGTLAQQTAAATKAVSLYPTMGIGEAVKSVSANDAWKSFIPKQGDSSGFQTYMNAEMGGPVATPSVPSGSSIGQHGINEQTQKMVHPTGEYGLSFQQRQLHANEFDTGGGGMITSPAAPPRVNEQAPSVVASSGVVTPEAPQASPPLAAGTQDTPSVAARGAEPMDINQRLHKSWIDQQAAAERGAMLRHKESMKLTELAHQRGMYGLLLQGGGALLQAWGAHQTASDEKEWREKGLKWKAPKDPIDVVNPNLRIDKTEVA
tara:strand:- start:3286 stop:4353 length:1068 start_codon:yes stop_codon:yes gene_type:complete